MGLALVAEVARAVRRLVDDRLAALLFAVQKAQRVPFQSSLTIGAELFSVTAIVALECLDVFGPALGIPDAVDTNGKVGQPHRFEESPGDFNDLGIYRGIGVAEDLDAELVVLSIPPGLWTFIAEERNHVVQADRLGEVLHAVLEVRSAYWGRSLGA